MPYTCAGARVPHLATRHRACTWHAVAERRIGADPLLGTWQERPLDDLGRQGHVGGPQSASIPTRRTVEALLSGPIRELLSIQQGLGFEIRIEYGQVIVSRQDFLRRDEDLDELVATAEALAGAVREICVPRAGARSARYAGSSRRSGWRRSVATRARSTRSGRRAHGSRRWSRSPTSVAWPSRTRGPSMSRSRS